ncbi:MAG: FAD-dependent monooxygenase [Cyanobacteria bacterium J06614_10]
MAESTMKHIAIAGAGPAGVATALLLAQRGFEITLVEQESTFDRAFRGEGLMPSGLAALHQMGLKETFDSIPSRQLDAWDFYVGGRRRMRVVEPVEEGLATQIFNQTALLEAMVQKAQQSPNFAFHPGCQVVELLRNQADGATNGAITGLQIKDKHSGQVREILADAVIAADGRYSRLRKLAGLAIEASPAQFDVLWFKLSAPLHLKHETPFVACLQPDRQFAFYPSWDDRLQLGWIVEKSDSQPPLNKASSAKDWIEAFAQALPPDLAQHFRQQSDALEGPIFLDVRVGCCEQWSVPGLLLIGDAAHPMAPNRAQGINMALRDAIVVTNHFVKSVEQSAEGGVNGPMPTDIFSAIQAERQPEVEAVQKMQLAEWRKVAFISQAGLPYQGFKAIASLFGRFQFAQNIWLHEQKGLREGVRPVSLQV